MIHLILQATKVATVILLAVCTVEMTRLGFVRATAATAATRTVTIEVAPHESTAQLGTDLQAAGLIHSPTAFQVEEVFHRPAGGIQPGEHVLQTGMAISQIVDALGQPSTTGSTGP